jgi:hypothetical protein
LRNALVGGPFVAHNAAAMYTASWQSEVYAHAEFSDSDDPDLDDDANPFNRNAAYKHAKARQLAAQRKRARQQALLASQQFDDPRRPRSAVAHVGLLPGVFDAKTEAALNKKGQLDAEEEALRRQREKQQEEDEARAREVEEATGSPRRKLDRDAAMRIQKYLEHESPQLRAAIEEKISRPTDLVAYHAARREAARRARQRRDVQRTFKNALHATSAAGKMRARARAAGEAGDDTDIPELARLNHGGIRAAVVTLLVRARTIRHSPRIEAAAARSSSSSVALCLPFVLHVCAHIRTQAGHGKRQAGPPSVNSAPIMRNNCGVRACRPRPNS